MTYLNRLLTGALLFAATIATAQQPTEAPGTLQRINASGRVVLGVRESSPPMSYAVGSATSYAGYQVELCEQILKKIVPSAKLEYMALTAQNTVPLVSNGTVDISCAATTNNEVRQRQVAFSLTTYVSQVRIATKKSSGIQTIDHLKGRKVVTSVGSTAVQMLRKEARARNMEVDVVLAKDHAESFLMLESDRADAFVIDDNVLAGLISNSRNASQYQIVGEPFASERIALMFRRDDPAFKRAVDDALRAMMKSGEVEQIYNRWFVKPIPPKNVALNLPMSDDLRRLLAEPSDAAQ